MKFPKLKNAMLCRILTYIVVIGSFSLPFIIAMNLKCLSDYIKVFILLTCLIGFIIYCINNFAILMTIDLTLAMLSCNNKARKFFVFPSSVSIRKIKKRISRFGITCESTAKSPIPEILKYKSSSPITVYSSGIEKITAVYQTKYLDKDKYQDIFFSARSNSKALKGRKKHLFLDKQQKASPINQVSVIIIVAEKVEGELQNVLFDRVCQNVGDGYDTAILPCVIDLENQRCTFDSTPIPYLGFQYPVKNIGIKLIKKYIFGGKLPYKNSPERLEAIKNLNPEQSLWHFWKKIKKEFIFDERKQKSRFKKMKNGEIIFEDDFLYIKWNERGICLSVELNEENKTAEIDEIDFWDYPKVNNISKSIINNLKSLIDSYFEELGYSTRYINYNDEFDNNKVK